MLQQHGLPTPAHAVVYQAHTFPALPGFPVIVKPLHEGSSKGISEASVVHTPAALQARVAHVLETYHQPALVEAFLPAREFTAALVGNSPAITVLPLVEICFTALPPGAVPLYSYEAKWLWDTPAQFRDILYCPADIPTDLARTIAHLCCRAFVALACRDWCRIDVCLDAHGQPHILELNPLPGILPDPARHSCFPTATAAAQIAYPALIRRVLSHAGQRYGLPL